MTSPSRSAPLARACPHKHGWDNAKASKLTTTCGVKHAAGDYDT
jgi:hypothetical protein